MLEGRTFGIPKKQIEKDPFEGQAKLIIKRKPENKGETYKFELTKQALVDLDLVRENGTTEKLVSYSFDEEIPIIGNTTSLVGIIDSKNQYNVSMLGMFSNKPMYEYLIQLLELDEDKDNVLDLSIIPDPDIKACMIKAAPILEELDVETPLVINAEEDLGKEQSIDFSDPVVEEVQ